MEKFRAFLTRKNIVFSARRYGIDALGAMAQGLFCSLLIGTIIKPLGTQLNLSYLSDIGSYAMAVSGPKLIVVGSAPMALNRLLQMHEQNPLQEVTIIAAANGFASVVELKEKLWDSGLNCIVVRGRKGGAPVAIAITNALLNEAAERKKAAQE